jgi:signal peptidase I
VSAPRATTGRFVAGLVGLFVTSTMAWLLLWAAASSLWQGSAPVLVASGSMGPSVRAGDLVVLEPYHSQEIAPGTVIRFDDPAGRGSLLHRVVEVEEDGTLRTKGDANAVVDSSAVDAGRITGVGEVLVPRAGLPVLWWRHGEWLALAVFSLVTVIALFVTRFALLEAYDPWRDGVVDPATRPPLRVAWRDGLAGVRQDLARDGPAVVGRRLVLRRGAELLSLGLAVAFLASSTTAWAAFRDTTANNGNTFAAGSLSPPTGLNATAAGCGGSTIVHVDTATSTSVSGTTVTVPRPAGAASGELLVAQVAVRTTTFTGTIAAPSGWTTVRVDNDANNVMQGVFHKWMTGSEPASYGFTLTAGSITGGQASGAITAYDGVDTTTPIDAHAGSTGAIGLTITAPSLSATVAGDRLLTLVGQRGNGTSTPASGMIERYDFSSGSQNRIQMADQSLTATGATGTRTVTSTDPGSWVAQSVALRPQQIALVGTGATGSAANGDADTIDLARPAGVAADDILVAHVVLHTHSFNANPMPAPAGWTLVRVDTDSQHVTAAVFWRRAGGSEPSTYTFTNNAGDTTQQATGAILAYRGLDTANPIDDDAGATDVSGTDSVVAPSVTSTPPTGRLLSLVGVYGNNQGPATPPGSMTERYEGTVVSEASVVEILGEAADQVLGSAGATGTRTTSVPGADTWVAQSLVLRPFVNEPYADLTWTPSTSTGVDGYLVERRIGATLDDSTTVTPGTASSTTDGPLTSGTTYTYRVIATAGSWRSAPASVTFTPSSC